MSRKSKEADASYLRMWRAKNAERLLAARRNRDAKNKDAIKSNNAKWYANNAERRKQQLTAYYQNNKSYIRNRDNDLRQRSKLAVFEYYSNGTMQCGLCGENRLSTLTVDHINGGGSTHRAEIRISGARFCRWLIKHDYPTGYRILCMNCNIKAYLSSIELFQSQTKSAIRSRKRIIELKRIVMNRIGTKCVMCGIEDIDILTVHHQNNDGANHRRVSDSLGCGSGRFYRMVIDRNEFVNLECRCYSCNVSEQLNKSLIDWIKTSTQRTDDDKCCKQG